MLRLQRLLQQERIDFSLTTVSSESLIPRARNFIVSQFLGRPHFTHLLFIDADIGFDPEVVPRYLNADKDVIGGIYPLKRFDLDAVRHLAPERSLATTYRYTTKLSDEHPPDGGEFARADYCGTGFMLIRRNVLEQMAAKYSHLKYEYSFSGNRAATAEDTANLYALFDTSLDTERGLYLPEDYTFCRRWIETGGEVWADVRSKFSHVGTLSFDGDFAAYLDSQTVGTKD
jgi:glycosyltransferase involved in cell wall biosynthesis